MNTYLHSVTRIIINHSLLFVLAFCFTTGSFAAKYYIDPSGNDATGNGSILNPWKTLFKATQTVTLIGDIIHVNSGTYLETQQSSLRLGVSLEGSGSSTSLIRSSITGSFSSLLNLSSPQDSKDGQSISALTLDGQYVNESDFKTWIAIWVTGRSNVLIHDMKIINFRDRGVIYDGVDATDPHSDPGHHATGNKFYNNIVLNSAGQNSNYGSGLLNIGGQLGMEIYGNTLTQDQRGTSLNGWPIKYWDEGWLKGVKIYNNILKKNPYAGTFPGQGGSWDFAIELFNISGLEIYGNTISGSIDLNYNKKGSYAFCAWIHDNTLNHTPINNNFESGIILEFATESILIENNTFNNVSSGIQFNTRGVANPGGNDPTVPPPTGGYSYLSNNVIRNNVFSNIYLGNGTGTAAAITIISEGTNDPQIQGLNIYNNTFIAKSGNAPFVGVDFTSMDASTASGRDINIRNNIINGFQDSWLKGSTGNPHITNMMVTHNDAFGNGNSNTPSWPGGNPVNYTYNNNLSVNPLFVSSTDYHLQLTSPVIDKGIDVGIRFFGNAPDMGYAEFGTGGPLAVTLLEFDGKESNGKNLLHWSTATETNSDYFIMERSSDARSFASIGSVAANGSSTTELKYYFTDIAPLNGINYYRLVMIDKSGRLEYSKIISITTKENHTIGITYVDLSSGTNTAVLVLYSSEVQAANIAIIDITGRVALNYSFTLQKGSNKLTKSISPLVNGIYYIKLFTKKETAVKNTFCRK